MTLEEVQELIINIIKGEDIEVESKDKNSERINSKIKKCYFF